MNALFEKPTHAIGEFVSTVCRITNETDARQFAADYVEWLSRKPANPAYTAEQVMRANIGFCFGEGMENDKIAMWVKVCNASHPWFGTTVPTAEQCLELGKAFARK